MYLLLHNNGVDYIAVKSKSFSKCHNDDADTEYNIIDKFSNDLKIKKLESRTIQAKLEWFTRSNLFKIKKKSTLLSECK